MSAVENYFVTITATNKYYGFKPFRVGKLFKIRKETDNPYDHEAIVAEVPFIDTIGYVANSTHTVYDGTVSAGRLYDKIGDYAYCRTMFITRSSVIALVIPPDEVEKDGDADEKENNTLN